MRAEESFPIEQPGVRLARVRQRRDGMVNDDPRSGARQSSNKIMRRTNILDLRQSLTQAMPPHVWLDTESEPGALRHPCATIAP